MSPKFPKKDNGTASPNAGEAQPVEELAVFDPSRHEVPQVSLLEAIRRTNEFGQDCWSSRELGRLLGYGEYRNFEPVVNKADQ